MCVEGFMGGVYVCGRLRVNMCVICVYLIGIFVAVLLNVHNASWHTNSRHA